VIGSLRQVEKPLHPNPIQAVCSGSKTESRDMFPS
jgi:hypothetical protein